ncbi:unnamed protein product [Adineta steineri]|uniref:Uncharacterized protein n=1 Tax=Adineta steineri TaxID=433720 RepID=A0A820TFS1_9BILA|nr:unnamed protein product [Adineta steineri]
MTDNKKKTMFDFFLAFMDSSSHRSSGKKDGNQVENQDEPFVQVKNQLMLDIQVAIRLEEQMLTLLNMTTEG